MTKQISNEKDFPHLTPTEFLKVRALDEKDDALEAEMAQVMKKILEPLVDNLLAHGLVVTKKDRKEIKMKEDAWFISATADKSYDFNAKDGKWRNRLSITINNFKYFWSSSGVLDFSLIFDEDKLIEFDPTFSGGGHTTDADTTNYDVLKVKSATGMATVNYIDDIRSNEKDFASLVSDHATLQNQREEIWTERMGFEKLNRERHDEALKSEFSEYIEKPSAEQIDAFLDDIDYRIDVIVMREKDSQGYTDSQGHLEFSTHTIERNVSSDGKRTTYMTKNQQYGLDAPFTRIKKSELQDILKSALMLNGEFVNNYAAVENAFTDNGFEITRGLVAIPYTDMPKVATSFAGKKAPKVKRKAS